MPRQKIPSWNDTDVRTIPQSVGDGSIQQEYLAWSFAAVAADFQEMYWMPEDQPFGANFRGATGP